MDPWVALAAAGAGYVAKQWKKVNKKKENSSESTAGGLSQKLILGKSFNITEDVGSMSSAGHLENDHVQAISEELGLNNGVVENSGNLCDEPWMTENQVRYDFPKKRSSLFKSRRSNLRLMKPLTSLDSCLLAQLYNEEAEMDEYVLSCFPSPSSPSVRPFIVTDGRKIIGREGANLQFGKNRLHKEKSLVEDGIVYGVPSLPYNLSLKVPRRRNAKANNGLHGKLSSSVTRGKYSSFLAGSTNGAILFGLGVSVGLICSVLGNKKEVDKLNSLLKQTESLVQDLQDELEMKDSLTVKELHIEGFDSQGANHESFDKRASQSFSAEDNSDGSIINNSKSALEQKGDEDFVSISNIEAELEAELQRLELNINSSCLERRLSDLAEADLNIVPDISQGELRPEMFGVRAGDQPYADQDGSGTCTPHPPNYSVSHQELTLRLHEVIQTRLEERIEELETALKISERKIQVMESVHSVVMQEHSDTDSISSPIAIEERNLMDQPVIMNLSGEALNAYNEAFDELKKMNEYGPKVKAGEKDPDLDVYQAPNGEFNPFDEHYVSSNVIALPRVESTLDWQISFGDIGCSGTESGSDDEFDKLLIKQIVEKNRRNSSAILNVERELF